MNRALALTLAAMIAVATTNASAQETEQKVAKEHHVMVDTAAPNFTLMDVSGNKHSLSDFKGKYVVLEWTNVDCPFVKKHYNSGNMQALQKEYTKKGVVWLRICSSAPGMQGNYDSKSLNAKLQETKAMQTAYLIDEDGTVGRMYGAKTTPHMFVVNPDGKLIYMGGIDDTPSTNVEDVKTAKNYVAACLDAAMKGEAIAVKTSAPYGCSVKYAKQ